MLVVSKLAARRPRFRKAAVLAVAIPVALLAACASQPPPPPPVQSAPPPAPAPVYVPPARG